MHRLQRFFARVGEAKKQMRGQDRPYRLKDQLLGLVGADGFEPSTLCSQNALLIYENQAEFRRNPAKTEALTNVGTLGYVSGLLAPSF